MCVRKVVGKYIFPHVLRSGRAFNGKPCHIQTQSGVKKQNDINPRLFHRPDLNKTLRRGCREGKQGKAHTYHGCG